MGFDVVQSNEGGKGVEEISRVRLMETFLPSMLRWITATTATGLEQLMVCWLTKFDSPLFLRSCTSGRSQRSSAVHVEQYTLIDHMRMHSVASIIVA